MFDPQTAVVVYCSLLTLLFAGLWMYYDRREHIRFEKERRHTVFHCIRCDQLYTAPAGTELCRCPRCNHENTKLKF